MLRKLYRFRLVALLFLLAFGAFTTVKFVSYAKSKVFAPNVPTVVATETLTDPVGLGTNNGDSKAQPGETLLATVTITNNGTDATGVFLGDSPANPLSPNGANGTALVGVIAVNDSYNAIGNVRMLIPTGAGGVLTNDINPSGSGTPAVSGFGFTALTAAANAAGATVTTANGSNVTLASDGTLTYDPGAGFTGSEDIFYTLTNGVAGSPSSIGKITVTTANKIWFVKAGAAAAGNGTLAKPFNCLSGAGCIGAVNDGAAGHPGDNDYIFIYGVTPPASFTGGITLRSGQKLIGEGATASLLTITAFAAPSGTNQLPSTGNAAPVLTTGSLTDNIRLPNPSTGNTLRGFTIGDSGGANGDSADIKGTNFGTLAVSEVTLNGTGAALNLTTGTLNGSFLGTTSTKSSAQGLVLNGVAGTVNMGAATISASGTQGISIAGSSIAATFGTTQVAGSATQGILVGTTTGNITFGNTTVTGGTDGVSFQNNSAGTRTFGTLGVSGGSGNAFLHGAGGGNVTVNGLATLSSTGNVIDIQNAGAAAINFASGAAVTKTSTGGFGVNIVASSPTFESLGINTSNGPGLSATTSGTITVTNATKGISAVGSGAQAAPAIIASGVTLNTNFSGATSQNSGNGVNGVGISLTSVSGSTGLGGGSISGGSGTSFLINGGTASVTYNGTIDQPSATRLIDIQNKTAGTVSLGGTLSSSNTSGTGILLNSNTGATINFTGGMNISTGANAAFTATAGGTVSATQNNVVIVNKLTTTTGTALNVANTTIGAAGLTFQSITAGTAASGPASGIILNGTGAGALTVTGNSSGLCGGDITGNTPSLVVTAANSADCTGGTIQRAATAISLTSTSNVSLTRMRISNNTDYGIHGVTVNGFTMSNSLIDGTNGNVAGGGSFEGSIYFQNLTGSASIANAAISGGFDNNITIKNDTGALNRITFNKVQAGSTVAANDDLNLEVLPGSGATVNATVQNSILTAAPGDLFQMLNNGTGAAHADLVFTNNQVTNNHPAIATGNSSMTLDGGNMTFHIDHSTFRDAVGIAILIVKTTDTNTLSGTFDNNTIGVPGTANSGSKEGDGMKIQTAGQGTLTVAVTNNHIHQYNLYGIEMLLGGGATAQSGTYNATITGNTIANPGNNPAVDIDKNGIHLNSGTVVGDTYTPCVAVGGAGALANSITGSGAPAPVSGGGQIDFRLRQRQSTTVRLPGYGGAATDTAAVIAFVKGNNGATPTGLASTSSPPGGGFVGGAACTQPTTMPALGTGADIAFAPTRPLGEGNAEIAFATPINNILGDSAKAEVLSIPRQASTDTQLSLVAELYSKLTSSIEPTVVAQSGPTSGSITTSPAFTLPAGTSVTIKYQLTVANGPYPAGLNNLTDAATVSGSNFSTVTATPAATIPLDASPSISIANTDGSGFAEPGATVVYAVSATNANIINGQNATGVKLTQVVPANTTFNLAASDPGWAVSAGNPGGCANGAVAGTSCTNTIGALTADGNAVTKNFAVDVTGLLAATVTSIIDTGSVADDAANGPNQGAPTSQADTDQVRGTWIGGSSNDWGTASNWVNGNAPIPGNNISVPTVGAGANAPTILTAGTDVSVGKVFMARDITIQASRTMTVNTSIALGSNKVAGAGTLNLINGATISFTPNQGWVIAALNRNFTGGAALADTVDAPSATITYPVGTASGYFPVDVTATAGSAGTLTIQNFDGNPSGTLNTQTLSRYWAVAATGGMQADMRFFYNATATPGMPPGTYQPIRVTSGTPTSFANTCPAGPCVDNTAKTIFMPGVTTFNGNWTAGIPTAPTAATVTVSGRVFAAEGMPLRNARVILDDGTGHAIYAITNSFGYYHFDSVQSGGTYLMNAAARGYTFTPRVVSVNDSLSDMDFMALP